MQEDWIYGLIGGAMIGIAASAYLLVNGRIMGASGILGGLIDGSGRPTALERFSFIAGLVILPFLLAPSLDVTTTNLTPNVTVIVVAGLLVGIGTRLANGCTSGHGVCGISRLSSRGIMATLIYLLAGGFSVLIFKNILEAI
jgi:uncharacterized membrane protein YedE/YeeE